MTTFSVVRGMCAHMHFRKGKLLNQVIGSIASQFRSAIAMPNTNPPIVDGEGAIRYRDEIMNALPKGTNFTPIMTIMLTPRTTVRTIEGACRVGVNKVKWYPKGKTTNAHNGLEIRDIVRLLPVLAAMEQYGMFLLIHPEHPGDHINCLDREPHFLPIIEMIAYGYPNLRIVIEHVSTAQGVRTVRALPGNVRATLTAHHQYLTLNDVIGGVIKPHNFCNPMAKTFEDREAIVRAATSGEGRFIFGSDDAAHEPEKKCAPVGCAGVYSGPTLLPLLIQSFANAGKPESLDGFLTRPATFYELPVPEETIEFVRKPNIVPANFNGIVPWTAGQTLDWEYAK